MNKTKQRKEQKKIKQEIAVQEFASPIINVQELVKAREFEITAMEKAISNQTMYSGAQRVFQKVKRHMRRRAASHNVKRLPKKSRAAAIHQLSKEAPKALTRRRKRKPTRLLSEILTRPCTLKWLETHIWHAKRMKMIELWGLKLAERRNQKSGRFLYRVQKNECGVHDSSYLKVIQLVGKQQVILNCLDSIVDPTYPHPSAKQYLNGTKQGLGFLHHENKYPSGAICQIRFLWKPWSDSDNRKLWIWVHPSSFSLAETELKNMIARDSLPIEYSVISDLLGFELVGPKSENVLAKALNLVPIDNCAHSTWKKLVHADSLGPIPNDVVFGLQVFDPRLRFPVSSHQPDTGKPACTEFINIWPADACSSNIWEDRQCNRPSEAELNSRRQNQTPGTPLEPLESDARIHLLVIRRSNGWFIVAPKGWGLSLWNSMIYSGARAYGILDRNYLNFENLEPSFPFDFPESMAYQNHATLVGNEKLAKYNRTPSNKRFNYEKAGIIDPFLPVFHKLTESFESNSIIVWHSPRSIDIIKNSLGIETLDASIQHIHQSLLKVMKTRNCFEKLHFDHQTIFKSFIRISLVPVEKGSIKTDARIYARDQNDELIGMVTSSGFSLSVGKSRGIGCCKLVGILGKETVYVKNIRSNVFLNCRFQLTI